MGMPMTLRALDVHIDKILLLFLFVKTVSGFNLF